MTARQVQVAFNIQLHHGQAENTMLSANVGTNCTVHIAHRYFRESLFHQALELWLDCTAHATLRSAKKEEYRVVRFQVFNRLTRGVGLHDGIDYRLDDQVRKAVLLR